MFEIEIDPAVKHKNQYILIELKSEKKKKTISLSNIIVSISSAVFRNCTDRFRFDIVIFHEKKKTVSRTKHIRKIL